MRLANYHQQQRIAALRRGYRRGDWSKAESRPSLAPVEITITETIPEIPMMGMMMFSEEGAETVVDTAAATLSIAEAMSRSIK